MFRWVLLLFSLCFGTALSAQFVVTIDLFETVGDIDYNIALDVDGDGDLEVICATNKRLFWVERQEDGSFGRQHIISPVGLIYRSLAAADVDEDGDQDLIYASQEGGLGMHLNLGDGQWGPAVVLHAGVIIECFVADLNGDGHVDILDASSSEVRWLPGNGNGTFDTPRLLSDEHVTTASLFAEDLDADGDLDVVVAAINGDRLSWHENLGNGNFSAYQTINDYHDGPRGVVAADMDGDNLPDLVVVNRQEEDEIGAGLVWYRNLGDANFELVDTLMAGGWHEYVHVEDMDNDGDLDILSCHALDELDWLANDGNGNFGAPQELARNVVYIRYVETPDLNNDGRPDLLYGASDDTPERQTVLWRASTDAGEWAQQALVAIGGGNYSKPALADFDQDGLLDVVVGSPGSEALLWLKNEGFTFSVPRLIARRANYEPNTVEAHDFNNDGWPDVLAGSVDDDFSSSSYFSVYINNQDGTFTPMPPFASGYLPQRDMELVDMDNDGDLDMLWANPGWNSSTANASLGWVRNDNLTWSEPIVLASEMINLLDVLVTDFDDDGQIDLVLCKRDAPQLVRMEHIGGGEFSSPQIIPSDFAAGMYAQAADVDNDGFIDLIASNEGLGTATDQIAWWRNLGDGQLGNQQNIFVSTIALEKFVFADFDLDGRKDIIASTYQDNPMQLLKQNTDGSFTAPTNIQGSPNRVRNFRLEDIDSDGDWDIIGESDQDFFGETEDRLFVSYNLANDQSISGIVFNDLDANGQQDEGELGVGRVPINVSPAALAVFANEEGEFAIYGQTGTYTLSPELQDCWALTTSPEAYEITFDGTESIDSLRFGVAPNEELAEAEVTLASAPTRCGFTVPFWLNYRNDGCWTFNGELFLVGSNLATFVSAEPAPSHTSGDTLFWNFSALSPGTSRSAELLFTIAGVEFLGSTIEMTAGLLPYNSSGQAINPITFDFYSTINCAYDPNDKQVYPNRAEQPPFNQNYTLFDETLLYTLRFQNTGTDTAFNIVLRDQLSEALDWSTFEPGSSSHSYEATLHDDGLLEFHFRDILLPDSTTNEPKSHGFVQFEIKSRLDLEPGASIDNTAGIYFDFNPPIITNTVNSMMVDQLPNFTPLASFNYSSNNLQTTFTDASTNEPHTWHWTFGDGSSSSMQNPLHEYMSSGTYTVCLTAGNDWGNNQYCEEISVIATNTNSPNTNAIVQLYPNPAATTVQISSSKNQSVRLYSSTGKLIDTIWLDRTNFTLDLSKLPAGSYWIRTTDGQNLPLVLVK